MTPQPASSGSASVGVNPWLVAVAVMLATFMEVLDTSIAAVALPYIAGSLSATNDEATWVLTSYLVAACHYPAGQFLVFSALRAQEISHQLHRNLYDFFIRPAAQATSLAWILIARAVQGAGGGALQPAVAIDSAGDISTTKTRTGYGRVRLGSSGRTGIGTHAGWMAHRLLLVAMGVSTSTSQSGSSAIFMISRYVEDPPYVKQAHPGKFMTASDWVFYWRSGSGACRSFSTRDKRTTGLGRLGSGGRPPSW